VTRNGFDAQNGIQLLASDALSLTYFNSPKG